MQHFVVNVFFFNCHDCFVFFRFVSLLLLLLMLPPLLPLLPLLLPLLSTVVYPMMLQVSLGQHFRQDCRVPAANLIGEEGPERPQGYENRGKLKQTWIFYVQRG